ncbi:hypothetical protein OHQ89_12430 [Streptomyces canus]|uniref:hypothetical protein n=1 Tax=Streptomyces canus TaxID=58343 RepID=UPI0030E5CF9E
MDFKTKWYNRDGDVIDLLAANRLLGDPDYKRVALTEITSASDSSVKHLVSTVWLGLDHSHTGGAPVIFETMVFGDGDTVNDEWACRYSREAEAEAGHAETVTVVAATVTDEVITQLNAWPKSPA